MVDADLMKSMAKVRDSLVGLLAVENNNCQRVGVNCEAAVLTKVQIDNLDSQSALVKLRRKIRNDDAREAVNEAIEQLYEASQKIDDARGSLDEENE